MARVRRPRFTSWDDRLAVDAAVWTAMTYLLAAPRRCGVVI
jgi:hypothetical protein